MSIYEYDHANKLAVIHKAMISSIIKRALLGIALRRPSPNRIPRSGDEGAAVNCYTTRVSTGAGKELIVCSANGNSLECLEYDGDRYSIHATHDFESLIENKFEFTHYHGLYTTTYFGWWDFAVGTVFRAPYIKAWIYSTHSKISQTIYNRKKLITKQRIDILKTVLEAELNGREEISSLDIMTLMYDIRWYLHPSRDDQHHRIELYLDALAETEHLNKSQIHYKITGHGIAAIESYEEEERKHFESISTQRKMLWLTIVIAALTIVQAGLIKLPPILELGK
ncbi:hypothetical protein [Gilvimarinus xylanilyticus]|uniref:Uncharacterized protein n=1 Tax=Gilvimarinus xylanilyticus TaxID=2944139 RepID=A0A9X2I6Q3_9GAMM|nr:hypothetical protein [Gilvimarinus xylanilyticus]MCP8899867.1 hypothetical protein [Gilvimarinus xylanilyticus]